MQTRTSAATVLDKGDETRVALTATQRTIARRMVESTTTVPHFALGCEIDMVGASALREDLRAKRAPQLPSLNDLVVRSVALALRSFPSLNGSYEERAVVQYGRINIGVAVAVDDALLVPVIFDADTKSLQEIAVESRLLVERARSRSLEVAELTQGTFTVSNLGMFGIRHFSAVINPPQAGILAVGEVARQPVVNDEGAIVARERMEVTLSCDHRIVAGADGARFLQRLRELLEEPALLL